ncbi:[Fe-Fe] hydrogenase large subunit C-terminal domain-containing protein [Sporomusa sp.]|uniref:[Fe-Fe] hydrogenase large subunit C-terminal domain-containing protein n=1 Tax=Sporomusa sp. TaxID=2078658 RepID=UPI002C3A7F15|nr:[Fe-Fe] hydrogenase large subunit C-terminal domain-containing protein [Sporomusa sp.]HWR45428.1 [Fe-Fe] hydrogenase large subunit C-terminal domain-containing protein [Sporomusa sp.]
MTYLWKECWGGNNINTIITHKVNCRDCFRCVRSCPIKAIGINKGHARVIEERCILCGRCVRECPQQAKQVDNQLKKMSLAIESGKRVILSLAPSYIAAFPEYTLADLAERVARAGVSAVAETAQAAEKISEVYRTYLQNGNTSTHTMISSCCPVVVNIVERYYPQLVNNLATVISPMLAHAKMIKNQYGHDSFVVFAGPCIAKIAEGSALDSQVDAVITFEQLKDWLQQAPDIVDKPVTAGSTLLLPGTSGSGRYFPITGGILLPFLTQAACEDVITVDGIENCLEVFEGLSSQEFTPKFVEAMACSGGCVGGPAMGTCQLMQTKRNKVIAYAKNALGDKYQYPAAASKIELSRCFEAKPINAILPSEDEVKDILKQTGKFTVKDEKNCGACGYDSCRAKAVAIFQGLAEFDMCVPYMRSKAESFANIIVEHSLNAIIAVNEKMVIKEFNPAVKRMFGAAKEIYKGMSLTELFECSDFIVAAKFGHKIVGKRVEYALYGIITEQMIIPVPEHGLVIAIITDVTAHEQRSRELQQMKLETVEKATEIINKQMHVAQEIAGLLGETTAETKSALLELIMLIKGKGEV